MAILFFFFKSIARCAEASFRGKVNDRRRAFMTQNYWRSVIHTSNETRRYFCYNEIDVYVLNIHEPYKFIVIFIVDFTYQNE